MSTEETYNGWANRETWAVALHINNDQGWQESVHEALRAAEFPTAGVIALDTIGEYARQAGDIIHEWVGDVLEPAHLSDYGYRDSESRGGPDRTAIFTEAAWIARYAIGSLWRVNWDELGAAFLADLEDES